MGKIKDYQLKTIAFGMNNSYAILALKMGLGKTLCALKVASNLRSRSVVVVPAYLLANWANEIEKWLPDKTYKILKTGKDVLAFTKEDILKYDFILMSYSLTSSADTIFANVEMCICDEATYLKEMTTKRTETLHRLIYEYSIKRVLLLTGTPIQNRVYEFYSLIVLCCYNPKETPKSQEFLRRFPSYVEFADYFSYRKEFKMKVRGSFHRTIVKWEGLKRAHELKEYLEGIYIRFDDSVLDLPESIDIEAQLSVKDMPEMLEAFNNFKGVAPNIKAKAALTTTPLTINYVESLINEGNDKIIVYTDHVDACIAIANHFQVKPIYGQISVDDRTKIADNFKKNEAVNVLVATVGSFSTGINLIESNHIVFNDPPWVPGQLEQAKYRIKRIGQTKTCYFHKILASKQSKFIYDTLENKNLVINELIN